MKLLIVAATELELKPLLSKFEGKGEGTYSYQDLTFHILMTGVGMLSTSYHLSKKLSQNKYDFVLNLGICGAFNRQLALGEVLCVHSDLPIEEGAEDGDKWISLEQMGLRASNDYPYQKGALLADIPQQITAHLSYKKVKAISVNRVLGDENTISKMQAYYHAEIESMEGAAVYYVCRSEEIPCLQLRAVSNYVENRSKEEWKIELALSNLAEATLKLLEYV